MSECEHEVAVRVQGRPVRFFRGDVEKMEIEMWCVYVCMCVRVCAHDIPVEGAGARCAGFPAALLVVCIRIYV